MTTSMMDSSLDAFFALLRAGLWEEKVRLSAFTNLDLKEVYRLAKEQTVIGLVAAGLEHASDVKAPKETVLHYIQDTVHLEQRNKAMNQFISELIGRLNNQGIESLLVKGQGIAQCYERPLWRAAGDVDLFLDDANYEKAKDYFSDIASSMEQEGE